MITEVYAHILDEDRKINAIKFDKAFYSVTADLRNVKSPDEETSPPMDAENLIEQIKNSPELLQMLSNLITQKD